MDTATKQKKNVPKLRFPEYKDEWKEFQFGEVGRVAMCKRVLKSQTRSEGDVPFYTIGTFGKSASSYIDKDLYQDFKTRFSFPKKGDVLISAAGTIGRLVVYDGKPAYFQDSNIVWIENNESLVTNPFLLFCYKNTKWKTEDTTIARLYNDNLKNTKSFTPSLSEQKKIADFLGSVDAWLDNLRQQKTTLETYKQGMMQKLFTQQIRFKDNNGKNFPEWKKQKLSEQFSITAGKTKSQFLEENGKFIVVDMGGISTDGSLIAKKYTNYPIDFLDAGDLVMPKDDIGGGLIIGRVAYIPKSDKYICGDHVYKLTLSVEGCAKFFFYAINSYEVNKEFKKKANGTAQLGLSKDSVASQSVVVPCKQEQQKIADFLTAIDQTITAKAEEISKVEQWKKGLMQKMFI